MTDSQLTTTNTADNDAEDDITLMTEHRHRFAFINDIKERKRRQLEEEHEDGKFSSIPFAPLRNFLAKSKTSSFLGLPSQQEEDVEEVTLEEVARELVGDDESWNRIIERIRSANLVTNLAVMIVCSDIFIDKREEMIHLRRKKMQNNKRGLFAKKFF